MATPTSTDTPATSAAPAAVAAAEPAATPAVAAEAAPAATAAVADAKPADAKPSDAKPAEAAPSLLAGADAGKREGAPATDAKPADAKPDSAPAADAKPADATKKPAESGDAKPPPGDAKKDEAKPADAKADADKAKPDGVDPAAAKPEALAEPPPAPKYDAPKLPDGQKLDDKLLSKFDEGLGKFEVDGKIDHALVEQIRQYAIDQYVGEMERVAREVQQHQVDVWNRINEQRIGELKADPQLGGNRIETTLGNAKYALESLMGLNKQEVGDLLVVMDAGGVSNHRLMIKALNNLYERLSEPQPVNPNLPSVPQGRGQRNWYDKVDGTTAA